jgi:hypothetical protein
VGRAGRWAPGRVRARSRALRVTARGTTPSVPTALAAHLHGDRTDLQWSVSATHLRAAWQASTGAGVVVAVLDTGADPTAPDLASRLLAGAHLDPSTGRMVAGSRPDELGHGTHVAGVIAAAADGHGMTGVAPDARILPVGLDPGDAVLTGADVAAGVRWATAHGAHVINLSLGFAEIATAAADVRTICQAVSDAVTHGVVVVAAAGNDGQGANNAEAPAACPGAISVAAVDSSLTPASWSSYDPTVTLAAPGTEIWSTVPTSVSPLGYATESGTSMASPFVAGVAALLLSQHPRWTPAQVAARLVATAADLPPAGRDPRTGAGLVDPAAALGVPAPPPSPVAVLDVSADPHAGHTDRSGRPVYDQVALHWVPDPTVPATAYRVTRWTAAGTTVTTVAGDVVRVTFPTGPAGYAVTAVTPSGEAPGAPLWFPLPGQDTTPVSPAVGLRAVWGRSGTVTATWTNPRENRGVADEWALTVDGDVVASGERVAVPTRAVVPASAIPPGDLVVGLLIGSSASLDSAQSWASLAARVPFSGVAVVAGRSRYRIELTLAASRRSVCGRSRCTGASVWVTEGGYRHLTRIDSRGQVVVLVAATPRRGRIVASVQVPGFPRLCDRAVSVPVG